MLAISEIERMSIGERLEAIELLWASIAPVAESISSPAWHRDVLSERQARVQSGEATFLSINELKERLSPDRS